MEIYCAGIDGTHEYAERICPACGQDFCFSCCGRTNVHEGGKYQPDFMTCPVCGFDICSDEDPSEHLVKARRRLEDRLRKDKNALRLALAVTQEKMTAVNKRRLAYLEKGTPSSASQVSFHIDGDMVKISLPEILADSDAGQCLASVLEEIQPGFGQLHLQSVNGRLYHVPEIEGQKEMFDLIFWVK
jgi:hypothetical protein